MKPLVCPDFDRLTTVTRTLVLFILPVALESANLANFPHCNSKELKFYKEDCIIVEDVLRSR